MVVHVEQRFSPFSYHEIAQNVRTGDGSFIPSNRSVFPQLHRAMMIQSSDWQARSHILVGNVENKSMYVCL